MLAKAGLSNLSILQERLREFRSKKLSRIGRNKNKAISFPVGGRTFEDKEGL